MKKRIAGGSAVLIATALICNFEGRNLVSFLDPAGIPTICDGHTAGVHLGQVLTDSQCDALLKGDLGYAQTIVETAVKVPMTPQREAALMSFTYNAGAGNFLKSTMLKKLNAGDTRGGCDELLRWTRAKGRVLKGLVRRREAERKLCLEGL